MRQTKDKLNVVSYQDVKRRAESKKNWIDVLLQFFLSDILCRMYVVVTHYKHAKNFLSLTSYN